MAHLRQIIVERCANGARCRTYPAGRASWRLYTNRNEELGGYCSKCAPAAVKERERVEEMERSH